MADLHANLNTSPPSYLELSRTEGVLHTHTHIHTHAKLNAYVPLLKQGTKNTGFLKGCQSQHKGF